MNPKRYYVYILTSKTRVLYIGMTNDLRRRVKQHQAKTFSGFTSKYNVHRLVYFEVFDDVHQAIAREKQLKGWRRSRKVELIESANPAWRDLSTMW